MKRRLREDFNLLTQRDSYSLLLFILYNLKAIPKYDTLVDIVYMFDKDVFLKLCQCFGGTAITIPTIDQLKKALQVVELYQESEINGNQVNENLYSKHVLKDFNRLKEVMSKYEFESD